MTFVLTFITMIVKCVEVTVTGRGLRALGTFVSLYGRHRLGSRRSVVAVHYFVNTGHGSAFSSSFAKLNIFFKIKVFSYHNRHVTLISSDHKNFTNQFMNFNFFCIFYFSSLRTRHELNRVNLLMS